MEETMVKTKWRFGGSYRKMSAEVRLLYAACFCFIIAQHVIHDHPLNSAVQIVALLAMIAAQFIRLRTLKG